MTKILREVDHPNRVTPIRTLCCNLMNNLSNDPKAQGEQKWVNINKNKSSTTQNVEAQLRQDRKDIQGTR